MLRKPSLTLIAGTSGVLSLFVSTILFGFSLGELSEKTFIVFERFTF
jgi:hypothetical protein